MKVTGDIRYIGVNDYNIDLFEGIYKVPRGMSYNSYVIMDEKIAIMDTVDGEFTEAWFDNLKREIGDKKPHYLIVQHMEPDHSANVIHLLKRYPEIILVATAKAFDMMKHYFGADFQAKKQIVADGEELSLGRHRLQFISAPMVHWPEVMVTYDSTDKVLFSADGFGKFGAMDAEEEWEKEARRYYFGIVGKYGIQVKNLLKKLAGYEIKYICSLHGPILKENIGDYISLYSKWASYEPEEGIVIAYSSVYGNTKDAVILLKELLEKKYFYKISLYDLARSDMSEVTADAFKYSKLVLATTTYNGGLFPAMREFIHCLTEREYQNRTLALIENGSWASTAAKIMREKFEGSKNITILEPTVKIISVLDEESRKKVEVLAEVLAKA